MRPVTGLNQMKKNRQKAVLDFQRGKYGVCVHWLGKPGMRASEWDRRVDAFDAEKLAGQLEDAGAGHLIFTLGQNSGHYASPNATYALLSSVLPCKCSGRDLISDLYSALSPRGIRLIVYLPSGGPACDLEACNALGWEWGFEKPWPEFGPARTGRRLSGFQRKWEAVIREWSLRWGNKVYGWWIDGCYFADAMYEHPDTPNFSSLAAALRLGNPDAILAFNPGVRAPLSPFTDEEDYTAGEFDCSLPQILFDAAQDGGEYPLPHVLGYLGQTWGSGSSPRFTDDLVAAYTVYTSRNGGVVTWDVPANENGSLADSFMYQLEYVKKTVRGSTTDA